MSTYHEKQFFNHFTLKSLRISGMFILVLVVIFACSKEGRQSQLTVKMKDAPGDFQHVNVEVLSVEVHNNHKGWVALSTNQGIYDLLTLQYDVTAVLVKAGTMPAGKIDQMRLILGNNNTVMIDSTYYPLETPSAQQSGLKINVNSTFDADESYEMLIDFDARKSIVQHANGTYSLKPVITLAGIVEL